ncbi:hypothetical protein HanRHA438_Chr16g0762151 [Helianthus annuus]|nr:hypothetical protein HanRHA438_Chr16g0762151 [Helianthus annuus]
MIPLEMHALTKLYISAGSFQTESVKETAISNQRTHTSLHVHQIFIKTPLITSC